MVLEGGREGVGKGIMKIGYVRVCLCACELLAINVVVLNITWVGVHSYHCFKP